MVEHSTVNRIVAGSSPASEPDQAVKLGDRVL